MSVACESIVEEGGLTDFDRCLEPVITQLHFFCTLEDGRRDLEGLGEGQGAWRKVSLKRPGSLQHQAHFLRPPRALLDALHDSSYHTTRELLAEGNLTEFKPRRRSAPRLTCR